MTSSIFAGTVRLYNDSSYKLRAVVRGNDGTYLGEMVVLPESTNVWSDQFSYGPGGQSSIQSPNTTMTPYTVHWACLSGDEFGVSINIPTGGAAIANSSVGPRYCKPIPRKRPESPYGPHAGDEVLPHQNAVPRTPLGPKQGEGVD